MDRQVTIRTLFKRKRIKDKAYLTWIRELPCLFCGGVSEPHHVPPESEASVGLKTDDTRALPFCYRHHQEYHNRGRHTFEQKYQINYEYLIERLNKIWRERNDLIEQERSRIREISQRRDKS